MLLLLVSCIDKRKRVVSEYEQSSFGNKTEMAFKLLTIKDVRTFYGKDSAVILKHLRDSLVRLNIEMTKILMRTDSSLINNYTNLPDKKNTITEYKLQLIRCQNAIDSLDKGFFVDPDIVKFDKKMKEFEAKSDVALYNAVEVTYIMKNPFENYVKEEFTKMYAFSPDNSKIISVLNEKYKQVK